jgi:hypothetical protein
MIKGEIDDLDKFLKELVESEKKSKMPPPPPMLMQVK